MSTPAAATILLLIVALNSCVSGTRELAYDNPKIRNFQKQHSSTLIPSKSEQKRLARKIQRKVFLLEAGKSVNGFSHSGRGVAISPDGYLLTAYHVVKGKSFFLSDPRLSVTQKKQLERDGVLLDSTTEEDRPQGRLVWFDEGADLAVVKFQKATPSYFTQLKFPSLVGTTIYSSDDYGKVAIPKDKMNDKFKDHTVGNGPYFSAGKVLFSQLFTHGPGVHTIGTTLVARGGMSGGPIVTLNGELCGILTTAGIGYTRNRDDELQMTLRSTSRMLPPRILRSIITQDRAAQ